MKRVLLFAALLSCSAMLQARTWVIPHVLEKSGMNVAAVYTGGLPGSRSKGGGATLELYLYSNDGKLMEGGRGGPVCDPCTWGLTAEARKQTIDVSALVQSAKGGKVGFGVLVVRGDDPDSVNVQGFVVNAGPRSPVVFGFDPQPIPSPAQ